MNKFNSRIQIKYQTQLDEVDDNGNAIDSWVIRIDNLPAERETIKGSLKDIANREQGLMYYQFTVWSAADTRAILSTDRLIDVSANRIHEIMNAYQTDDNRKVIILTRSADNQNVYEV
jgi:hypothetical protein